MIVTFRSQSESFTEDAGAIKERPPQERWEFESFLLLFFLLLPVAPSV